MMPSLMFLHGIRAVGSLCRFARLFVLVCGCAVIEGGQPIGSEPLTMQEELSSHMISGLHRFLDRELADSIERRQAFWKRDFQSRRSYEQSVAPNRERLRRYLGVVDELEASDGWEEFPYRDHEASVGTKSSFSVRAVRWKVLDGVNAEGLLLEPKQDPLANTIVLPDADQLPEELVSATSALTPTHHHACLLAENRCRVLIPCLLSRDSIYSGSSSLKRKADLSHREWIWRMAFEVGRSPAGFEVQKVLAAVDCFQRMREIDKKPQLPIGVAGYGEGGRIALFAAALDPRIDAAWVSGALDSRQALWREPVDRTVWSYLSEFGDAEVASLIAPRTLVVEYSDGPRWSSVRLDAPKGFRSIAAPGELNTPPFASVAAEIQRARNLVPPYAQSIEFAFGASSKPIGPGSIESLIPFLKGLQFHSVSIVRPASIAKPFADSFQLRDRQQRTVKEMEAYVQRLVAECERTRSDHFWNHIHAKTADEWIDAQTSFRQAFDEQVIGKWARSKLPLHPRSRPAQNINGQPLAPADAAFEAWDVVLDVFPDVIAWGVLLLPKDLQPDERRPVVVCQHGLEGLPEHCIVDKDQTNRPWTAYKAFAAQLAKQGFIVFVPHNPYRGGDAFRLLQRKSWLLGRHLFSIINAQHSAILDWLETQPYVDATRIGFYGLSYGGKSAMRIPAVEPRYCLSICSGDFNEWVRKNAAVDYPTSYLYTSEYEIFEWDLGHTLNYAEMAALIAPRPFMVEHGYQDRVATAEWASYEYSKVRRFYDQLGIGERTNMEFFDGPHTIHGQGTFEFLRRHLNWYRAATQ